MEIDPDDLAVVLEKDPAVVDEEDARKYHTGFHAVCYYRMSHRLWLQGRKDEARELNYYAHHLTGCDIHPGATIGKRFFIDHATGVVIGETAIIGDNVSLYQGVTLGGVSTSKGKRHPTIGNHVVVGCNASVLGDITIGSNVRIGAGAVVIKDVPDDCTVVGVPGRIVRHAGIEKACYDNMHNQLPDPMKDRIHRLEETVRELTERIEELSGRSGRSGRSPRSREGRGGQPLRRGLG
ncbi:MAG: serine O-acetyltransferase [Candidatus Methanomethylophilaceae archaeon]|nr:serine O-acetyltransferase [Candidatus Methanomethylophilaceae archaeon]